MAEGEFAWRIRGRRRHLAVLRAAPDHPVTSRGANIGRLCTVMYRVQLRRHLGLPVANCPLCKNLRVRCSDTPKPIGTKSTDEIMTTAGTDAGVSPVLPTPEIRASDT